MFKTSNNKDDYKVLLVGIEICNVLGAEHLKTFSNSQLMVKQVKGEYEACDVSMVAYLVMGRISLPYSRGSKLNMSLDQKINNSIQTC